MRYAIKPRFTPGALEGFNTAGSFPKRHLCVGGVCYEVSFSTSATANPGVCATNPRLGKGTDEGEGETPRKTRKTPHLYRELGNAMVGAVNAIGGSLTGRRC